MTIVEDYQTQTQTLATRTAARAAEVYAALRAGHLTQDEAEQLIATLVNTANAASFTLADAYVSLQIEKATTLPAPTTGITPVDDYDRLLQATHTILDGLLDAIKQHVTADAESADATTDPAQTAGMRLQRLARSEPLEAGQNAAVAAMTEQPLVEGWTRQMDADPCQLCQWWDRDGRIWPKDHPFQSHKGCNCQPKVVLAQSIRSTEYTRRLERANAPTGTRFPR
ncbi:hypothetical protein C3477_23855 [Mycobacterium kansasii]|uniref:hypothetical protein n=1 Tax=Mycobacterium kansasii TaxID=1768 RepID=UPI000CDD3688|nr:hypothetical protein [Mycobacterium kansasii]POX82191.1 hypothetical protein C3B43_25820 [Mycobacterium kansasii]POX98433.1 hypothetical protein C3477_23855 [Mycobacterium kansasii]POY20185.1 hypothetical protein C3476_15910 [Mycobacterium kansasii]